MGFGERLQREREMRGITLDEIANATKIGTRSLRALEQEDFKKLPGGIFNKGFVRAYARYLGIDEEQVVADYMAATEEPDQQQSSLDDERLKKLESNWKPAKEMGAESEKAPTRVPWGALAVLVAVIAGVGAGWHFRHKGIDYYHQWRARRHPQSEQITVAAQQTSAAAYQAPPATPAINDGASAAQNPMQSAPDPRPADATAPSTSTTTPFAAAPAVPAASAQAATGNAQPEIKAAEGAQEFVLLVRARQDSWVEITADGKRVLKGTLKAAREESIRAHDKVTLTAGNAGGIEVSFNGKPQPSLGDSKQVRTVTFTPEGMQQ